MDKRIGFLRGNAPPPFASAQHLLVDAVRSSEAATSRISVRLLPSATILDRRSAIASSTCRPFILGRISFLLCAPVKNRDNLSSVSLSCDLFAEQLLVSTLFSDVVRGRLCVAVSCGPCSQAKKADNKPCVLLKDVPLFIHMITVCSLVITALPSRVLLPLSDYCTPRHSVPNEKETNTREWQFTLETHLFSRLLLCRCFWVTSSGAILSYYLSYS